MVVIANKGGIGGSIRTVPGEVTPTQDRRVDQRGLYLSGVGFSGAEGSRNHPVRILLLVLSSGVFAT